jgi:V/A-type H+-transporting ATPase subunit D
MAKQVFPTKGNLMACKKSLELASMGFDLLDKKRNILTREMMSLVERAQTIQTEISEAYSKAYKSLQMTNMTMGDCTEAAHSTQLDNGLEIEYRSVMGVEIPTIHLKETQPSICYPLVSTNSLLDEAYFNFCKAKKLTVELSEIESSVYKLANAISKTQKRANALKNIVIPDYEKTIKFISENLEEKEREDFSRLKVVKDIKAKKDN